MSRPCILFIHTLHQPYFDQRLSRHTVALGKESSRAIAALFMSRATRLVAAFPGFFSVDISA